MTAPLIAISGLTVDFDTGRRVVRALHGVEFAVARGEAVGLVGESGSGKSVTWLAALGLLGSRARIGGSALLDGTELVGAPVRVLEGVRGKRIAMIFQDPSSSLNPAHRIGRQIGEALALHRGLGGNAARAEAVRLLDRVGIPARKRPGASGCTTPRSMRNLDTPICVRTVQPRERSCSATANSRSLS